MTPAETNMICVCRLKCKLDSAAAGGGGGGGSEPGRKGEPIKMKKHHRRSDVSISERRGGARLAQKTHSSPACAR